MSYRLVLADGEAERIRQQYAPTAEKMAVIADLLKDQVEQRFETQGASGGTPWPSPKWTEKIGRPDGRKLLQGRTNHLRESYQTDHTENTAEVFSDDVAAYTNQQGTRSRGGSLPDITPKHAKMLFIPISEKAHQTNPVTPWGKKNRHRGLVQGHIVNGKLVPPDADYILAHKSSIPPRPMLPDGKPEIEAQTDTVVEVLAE